MKKIFIILLFFSAYGFAQVQSSFVNGHVLISKVLGMDSTGKDTVKIVFTTMGINSVQPIRVNWAIQNIDSLGNVRIVKYIHYYVQDTPMKISGNDTIPANPAFSNLVNSMIGQGIIQSLKNDLVPINTISDLPKLQ